MSQEKRNEIDAIIEKNALQPHPEGGFYKETYRSEVEVTTVIKGKECKRKASTAIIFLICDGNVSRLHRIEADEIWHFYSGGALTVVEVDDVALTVKKTIVNATNPQYTVKRGVWFGSYCEPGVPFSFVGCTVAPGFEFEDFELADRAYFQKRFSTNGTNGTNGNNGTNGTGTDKADKEKLEIINKMTVGL